MVDHVLRNWTIITWDLNMVYHVNSSSNHGQVSLGHHGHVHVIGHHGQPWTTMVVQELRTKSRSQSDWLNLNIPTAILKLRNQTCVHNFQICVWNTLEY